jgi:hypothetical protein
MDDGFLFIGVILLALFVLYRVFKDNVIDVEG